MIQFPVPLLGFAASSGTGKTTLLTKLIPLLKKKKIRIAIIKHSHHNVEIDNPEKDSYKLRKAGAQQTVIASPKRTSIIVEHPQQEDASLLQALSHLQTDTLDLVLVEGFKFEQLPKIELHRKTLGKPYFYPDDENIIAVASDCPVAEEDCTRNFVQLDINNPEEIASFVASMIKK